MLTTLIYSLFALDQTLANLAAQHFALMLAALFIVIFAETGLVIFPLLPGDSLLFVSGTVVAATDLNIHLLVVTLFAAAVLGDSANYAIGHFIGPKAFSRPQDTWLGRCGLGRLARLRRLPVRQHSLGQGQSRLDRPRDCDRFAAADGRAVHQGALRPRECRRRLKSGRGRR